MNEQVKPRRGRPAKETATIERQKSDAVLKKTHEIWRNLLGDDKLNDAISGLDFDVKKEIFRGHSPNMPKMLILAVESAGPEFMTPEQIETAIREYKNHILWVSKLRRQGQHDGKNSGEAKDRHQNILNHPRIAPIAAQVKPMGKLTPNGAASRAIEKWQTPPIPNVNLPSRSTLRKIFARHAENSCQHKAPEK